MRTENWQCIWSGETEQKKQKTKNMMRVACLRDRKGWGNRILTTLPRSYTTERREIEQ